MAGTKWTNEQWAAITAKECNLLVAAAAGAGKTAVLVERIIKKITDPVHPVDIDRLLVVTFTNAAAAEMRERIAGAVAKALEENPGSRNMHRQLTLLNKAHITTIHSFCLEVMRSNFQYLDLDPNFRIADETEATLMKLDVLDHLFEDLYEDENLDQDFLNLLECYGGNRDDQALQDLVLNLYRFIQSSPWPEKWLAEMTEGFHMTGASEDFDFGATSWGKILLDTVSLELTGMEEMMATGVNILTGATGLEKNLAIFQEELSQLRGLQKLCSGDSEGTWDDLHREVQDLKYARLSSAGKNGDKELHERAKALRDKVKERMKKISTEICTAPSQEIYQEIEGIYPLLKSLTQLVMEFGTRYAIKKNRKGVVDFNDLEHFCLEILTKEDENGIPGPSLAAHGYRERFAEILVDEYQDSNLVQEAIIGMISRGDLGEPNVFMVGDVKQSIYRFRQAKPELFLEKYHHYSPKEGDPYRCIQLYKNFRSRWEVVQGVNFIFKQIMSQRVGELDYTDEEALNPGAVFAPCEEDTVLLAGGKMEFHLMTTEDDHDHKEEPGDDERDQERGEAEKVSPEEEDEILDKIQWEARLVATRIQDLLRPDEQRQTLGVWDQKENQYRKPEYKDMVILLRTTKKWSDVFMEELSNLGIPAFADTGTGFFKSPEIQVVLSYLQIIDNPLQDIPLLGVLRSPIVAMTTDELAELRLSDRKGSLYHALQALSLNNQGPGAAKATSFLAQLARFQEGSRVLSTDRLIWQLYQETGYYSLVGAMPTGEQRQANLRILFERARQFEATSYKGLFNFINFVDKLKTSQGDMGAAKILGENNNVVRIMSIHKSKGLEFPVVFLSGCGKQFNLQDLNGKILLHQDLGFGPEVVDPELRLSYPSAPKLAIREKIRRETLSEEMRILYVAMTRAKEKLIITGVVPNLERALAKWGSAAQSAGDKLPPYEMLKGNRYMDWLGPAMLRHPDAGILRELGGLEGELNGSLLTDDSSWQIRVWKKGDLLAVKEERELGENQFIRWLDGLPSLEDSPLPQELEDRLSWAYPYQQVSRIPAKVTVTELKRWFQVESTEDTTPYPEYPVTLVQKPLFLQQKKGLSGAEKGTIMHFVMQHLDYQRGDIEGQLAEMQAKDLLTPEQAASINPARIRAFFPSPWGQRLLSARAVYREVPFFMEIPCHELYPNMEEEACRKEKILLQGVIDCYFEEQDGLVLLDYKTDYVPAGKSEGLRERYRLQISYYTRALEMLTGKKVKDKVIYLFETGETLEY
ncbi:helicase-exonuclease AddAB subunit AddA [Dehalobacterium formicoaceticum]|uniref:helicase-exonuclease AddAB subunit AddA n=1 Tax=Dehalobacterium formicoaceticum TaxID=51515 RepID=UPI0031F62FCE